MVLAQHKEGNILLGVAEWYFEGRSRKSSNTLFECHVIGYLNRVLLKCPKVSWKDEWHPTIPWTR